MQYFHFRSVQWFRWSHQVRPESYIKMDNFYTVTVYEKGAEVVRMYQTLLGKAGFRKGMDLYFQRHVGQVRGMSLACVLCSTLSVSNGTVREESATNRHSSAP